MKRASTWKQKAIEWAAAQNGNHFCKCGCGKALKICWYHLYGRFPKLIKGHHNKIVKSPARQWIDDNQGKHTCQCGCGGVITIQIQHHVRGVPRFLDGHYSRANNPMTGRFADKNPNYNSGRHISPAGYVLVLVPPERRRGKSKYVPEHRLVVEAHIGRELTDGEVVHHKDRNKTNNHIDNLQVMTPEEHSQLHADLGHLGRRKAMG